MSIPSLKPFAVGNFILVDVDTLSDAEERNRVTRAGRALLLDLIQRTRTTPLCSDTLFLRKQSEAWHELVTRNSNANWAAFRESFDPGLAASDCDPRLGVKTLGVYRDDPTPVNFVGVFFLYNVRVLRESRRRIEVSSYPAPAIPFDNDVSWARMVRSILKRMLEASVTLVDGREMDMVSWEFPTTAGEAWSGEPWAERLVADLVADGFSRETEDGKLRRFKRITRERPR